MSSPEAVDARNDALDKLMGGSSGDGQGDLLTALPSSSKAQRRQTAYYPLVNSSNKQSKPFSRSAAKRESVLQLGSIEHLQHYFTKSGLKTPDNPQLAKKLGLGPALPHLRNPNNLVLPTIIADFDMPPSPAAPPPALRAPFASFERTYEVDPEALKPGVLEDLAAVVRTWHLENGIEVDELPTPTQNGNSFLQPSEFNVLAALKNTTRAIRSVRNYVLALPDEPRPSALRQFRPGSLANVPRATPVKQSAKHGVGDTQVRMAALDVLTTLRELEEKARIPGTENADDPNSSMSSGFLGEGERSVTPSSIGSDERRSSFGGGAGTSGRSNSFSVPVWEDDDEEEDLDLEPKREGWDERLVLGGGWLYRADIKIAELAKERAIIQRYLDVVDRIVFASGDGRGMKSPPKLAMTLTEEPEETEDVKEVQDRELPNWARRHAFSEDLDGTNRARAFLASFLPAALLPLLPIDGTRQELLAALSSGQVLCVVYNAAVRKSKKPWGYINADAIHDIASETSTNDKVWTFRKIENLRLFNAAVKLRYLIPLVAPGQNVPPGPEAPIVFDARVIARHETGWEDSLERVLRRWLDAVVAEKRAER